MVHAQGDLFSPITNRGVFSSHWLEHRLELEPEWAERADEAADALARLEVLWAAQKARVGSYGNEQQLEYAFIQPVMRALGWHPIYQTFLKGREPDYALFLTDDALAASLAVGHKSDDFWKYPAVVADAKKWDLSLDRKLGVGAEEGIPARADRSGTSTAAASRWGSSPTAGCGGSSPASWGRTSAASRRTTRSTWPPSSTTWPGGGLGYGAAHDFRRFFLLFGPAGFAESDGRKSLVQRAVEGSSEYRVGVSEGLKEKAFEALRICIEGFLAHSPNDLDPHLGLSRCRENSFILLCRLLFIMYAEDRRLLAVQAERHVHEQPLARPGPRRRGLPARPGEARAGRLRPDRHRHLGRAARPVRPDRPRPRDVQGAGLQRRPLRPDPGTRS